MTALHDSIVSIDGVQNELGGRVLWNAATSKLYWGDIRTSGQVAFYSLEDKGPFDLYDHGTPRTAVVEVDDHANPALCLLDNGELLVGYSQHVGDSWTARANGAGQIRDWNTPVQTNGSDDYSYVDLIQLGDSNNTCLLFARDDTNNKRIFFKSTDRGSTWGSKTSMFNTSGPYPRYRLNGTLRVDFITTDVKLGLDSPCKLYAGYIVFSSDGTSQQYYKLDGTEVTSPPFDANEFTLVFDASTGDAGASTVDIIGGNPVYTWVRLADSATDHFYNQSRWSGSAIVTEQIVQSGDGTQDSVTAANAYYAGGVTQDPNDINVVYLSKKYGSGDFRIEKWTHTGTFGSGSWSKTTDISGNTGTINFRPTAINCSGTTQVFWSEGSYVQYNDWGPTRVRKYPSPDWKKAKPASPIWTSGLAPAGVQAYWLLNEGSGHPQDLSGNGYHMALTGSLWQSAGAGDHGAYLSGFTSSVNLVHFNSLGAAFPAGSTPAWLAVLIKNTDSGTSATYVGGLTGGGSPYFLIRTNDGDAHAVGALIRNDASDASQPIATIAGANGGYQNDGEYHVIMLVRVGSSSNYIVLDGKGTQATDTVTTPFTFTGGVMDSYSGEVHAALAGWGSAPDYYWLAMDLIRGQFAGTFNPDAGQPTAKRFGGVEFAGARFLQSPGMKGW